MRKGPLRHGVAEARRCSVVVPVWPGLLQGSSYKFLQAYGLGMPTCGLQLLARSSTSVLFAAMPFELCVPDRRVRRKTWLGFEFVPDGSDPALPLPPPLPVAQDEHSLPEEVATSVKRVYLVTLPALQRQSGDSRSLVCPSTWKHQDVAAVLVDAFRRPAHTRNNAGWGRKATELECMVVFRERHAPRAGEAVGPFHWHIALKASSCFRFAPFKRSLAVNHGLASHWSSTHTGLWSAIRYGYIPSPDKPQEVLDPEPFCWHVSGEPMDLFALSQEPLTAAALARSREAKVKQARSSGKAEPRATELDLYPIIVRHGFRNGPDDCNAAEKLVSYLKAHGSPALQAFAFKNRVKLSSLIDDVWSWETVDDFLALHAQSRLDTLKAAAGTACVCHGQWMQTAMHSLMLNGIDPAAFCQDIYCLLANGRREDVPVLVLMGRFGGEGRSFWLSPLRSVYGVEHVQATPQPGNFPLLGLERKKVVLLDDWSFDAEVLPLPTQLLWYEGKPFPLSRPQNSANYTGHILYQGSAPIFVTCKEKDLGPLQEKAHIAFLRGHPSEHTMLLRRLKVHSFHRPLPVRQSGNRIPECQRCFGQLVLQYGQT